VQINLKEARRAVQVQAIKGVVENQKIRKRRLSMELSRRGFDHLAMGQKRTLREPAVQCPPRERLGESGRRRRLSCHDEIGRVAGC
jgi:hypothetical protein